MRTALEIGHEMESVYRILDCNLHVSVSSKTKEGKAFFFLWSTGLELFIASRMISYENQKQQ